MFKSILSITVLYLLLTTTAFSLQQSGTADMPQTLPGRQRDTAKPLTANEAVDAANKDIAARVNELLANVNEAKEPNLAELSQISDTVKKNMQNLQRTTPEGQSNLQLLNAWMSYFSGDTRRARVAANAAYKANPKNKDAESTYIMMCIVNNDIKAAKSALNLLNKNAKKPAPVKRGEREPQQASRTTESAAVLNFDPNLVKPELMDKSIGFSDISCLNGTLLPYKEGKTLFLLLWSAKLAAAEQSQSFYGSRSNQKIESVEFFQSLFLKDFANNNIGFLGLNLDANEPREIMNDLTKNAWPWPQAMAEDPRNTSLQTFVSLKAEKPELAILGDDGIVKYAGAFSNPLIWIVERHAAQKKQSEKPETVKQPQEPNAAQIEAPLVKEPNKPAVQETPKPAAQESAKPAPTPRAQKSKEETFNPQAQDLYNNAVAQMKMAHITGYGTPIRLCRQILQEYPDTPEAQKARELLRQVPDNKKQQFHITNEEMGL